MRSQFTLVNPPAAANLAFVRTGDLVATRYKLTALVGTGGMGVVWAATDTVSGERVALKFLRPELATSSSVRLRFLREAQACEAISHPNLVFVRQVGSDGPNLFIAMDYLDGQTLAAYLSRTGALNLERCASILLPVISALGTVHAHGIVHRDLKPHNVFVCSGDGPIGARVRVLDFGIAKVLAPERLGVPRTITNSGALLGTPHYMSPEQVYCEPHVDHRSDAWALGIMLYETLSGVRPTQAPSLGQILKRITTGGFPPLRAIAPGFPESIYELSERLLSVDRACRPLLAEVRDVLKPYAPHDDSPNFPPPAQLASDAPTFSTHDAEAEAEPEPEEPDSTFNSFESAPASVNERTRTWLGASAFGLVAVLGITWAAVAAKSPAPKLAAQPVAGATSGSSRVVTPLSGPDVAAASVSLPASSAQAPAQHATREAPTRPRRPVPTRNKQTEPQVSDSESVAARPATASLRVPGALVETPPF